MKKLMLVVTCLLFSAAVMAQGEQKMWLSGKVGYSVFSDDADNKVTSGSFMPSFGLKLNDKIAVGIGIGYDSEKEEEKNALDETISTTTTEIKIMPFVRYYRVICERVSIYGELNAAFGSGKVDWSEYDDDDTYSMFCVGVAPGIQYWICDRWSFNAVVGVLSYSAYNDKGDFTGQEDFKSNELEIGLKFSRTKFGLNFHF